MIPELPQELRGDALHAFLLHVGTTLGPDTIDELWVFPVQRAGTLESTVVVVSALEVDPDRRRVITAHRTTRRAKKGDDVQDAILEHGAAPAERLSRLVDGVLRRIGDDVAAPPHLVEVRGEPARWDALLAAVAGA